MKRVALAAALACGACAKGGADPTIDDPQRPTDAVFAEAGTQEVTRPECVVETQQVYVVGTDRALYRFYPQDLRFQRIGNLDCPSTAGTFSMAVDRRGIAYVEYVDGRLYQVDTFNAKCKATAFQPGQTGFEVFGMGFAKNGDDENSGETLYAAGAGLAAIDVGTFQMKFLGSLTFGRTELTPMGTELYAYSVESGVLARLNKMTAATEVTYRTTAIEDRAGFALAQWGGDFWIFTGQERSKVTVYSPATDTSTVVIEDTGMLIVGAGSSTCAPTKRPR